MYDLLLIAFEIVEKIGAPIAIAAWLTVSLGSIGMAIVLRGRMRGLWAPSLFAGALAVAAHGADIFMTLKMSPDLALEGNPIWLIVVEHWGLPFALFYGISGQALVCVLSVQLYAWYLLQRDALMPERASSFVEFVRRLGERSPRRYGVAWRSAAALFAFLFATLGPFFFYVAFLNSMVLDEEAWNRWPSPAAAISLYLVGQLAAYFGIGWRVFRRQAAVAVAGP